MKRFKMWSAAAVAALLLTSCLGDSSNSGSLQDIPVVMGYDNMSLRAYASDADVFYSPNFTTANMDSGECYLISFNYDFGAPENANVESQGYLYVNLTSNPTKIKQTYTEIMPTDTTTLLMNEIALENAIASYGYYFASYTKGYTFFASSYTGLNKQENSWHLYFDQSQEPVKDENGINIYTLHLRSTIQKEGEKPSASTADINAYNIRTVLSMLEQRERANSNKSFAINYRYLSKIEDGDEEDEVVLTWKNTEKAILYNVTEDGY